MGYRLTNNAYCGIGSEQLACGVGCTIHIVAKKR